MKSRHTINSGFYHTKLYFLFSSLSFISLSTEHLLTCIPTILAIVLLSPRQASFLACCILVELATHPPSFSIGLTASPRPATFTCSAVAACTFFCHCSLHPHQRNSCQPLHSLLVVNLSSFLALSQVQPPTVAIFGHRPFHAKTPTCSYYHKLHPHAFTCEIRGP